MTRHALRLGLILLTVFAAGSTALIEPAAGQGRSGSKTVTLDPNAPRPKAKIGDMAWLAGSWAGEGLGGTTEEVWSPPMGDSMMGMFRLVKGGKVVFSELMFLTEDDGSLVLKLKHFDGAFKGWEEKDASVRFPLAKLGTNEAFFDGLTIRKADDGTLTETVAIREKTGEIKEEDFTFRARAPR